MFLKIRLLCLLLLVVSTSFVQFSSAQVPRWTMRDVEIAYSSKNFVELQENILSIPPSSRNQIWIEALRDTIAYQLKQIKPGARILVNLDTLELFKPYLAGDLIDYDFRVNVAKFLRLHTQRHANAIEWFRYALDKDSSKQELLCKDEDLKLAVLDGLHLSPKEVLVADSVYFANLCYQQLAAAIKESLTEANADGFANICPILKRNNALEGSIIKLRCAEQPTL